MEHEILTVPEAAKRLRVSQQTVYELAQTKRIRCVRIGRRVLIPNLAIDEFIAASGSSRAA